MEIVDIECPWLDELQRRLDNPGAPLREAGEGLLAAMRAEIEGGRLAPLAEATRRRKAELGQPSTPLVATGGLLDSLRPGGRNNVLSVSSDTVEAGTTDAVAALHVDGTARLPRRDFTQIPDATYDDIAGQVLAWMAGDTP